MRLKIRTTKDSLGAINFMLTSGERVFDLVLPVGELETGRNVSPSLAFAKKLKK